MEKNQANAEQIIHNVLSRNVSDKGLLTPERVSELAEQYLQTGSVLLLTPDLSKLSEHIDVPTFEALNAALYQEFWRYNPNGKKAYEDAAPVIPVKVLGMELPSFIDVNGTQRFKTDTVIINLFERELIDLDALSHDYYSGKITTEDLLNFYAKSGYSVAGLASLSHFSHLTFENPLWDDESD